MSDIDSKTAEPGGGLAMATPVAVRISLLLGLLAVLHAPTVRADFILDQFNVVYSPVVPDPTGGAAVYFGQTVAQTFQVGVSGTLGQIAVDVFNSTTSPASQPLIFELRPTLADGSPDPTSVLLTRAVPSSSVPVGERAPVGYVVFDLRASRIQVTAGQLLAFSLYSNDISNNYGAGLSGDNAYLRGQEFFRSSPGGSGVPFRVDSRGVDLRFLEYVYVEVVPEPSSMVILGTGILSLICWGWRRSDRGYPI